MTQRTRTMIDATIASTLAFTVVVATANAAAPPVPDDLHCRPAGIDVIHVVCDPVVDPDGDAVEYRFRDLSLGTQSAWMDSTRWVDRGLDTGSLHEYVVEVRDATGALSGTSPSASARTFDAPLEGFGTEGGTVGGLYEAHYRVTSLADTDTEGTLRFGMLRGSAYITFDVAGDINLGPRIRVTSTDMTVDGFSAPAPGITVRPSVSPAEPGIVIDADRTNPAEIRASNIILRGIRITGSPRDNFAIGGEGYDNPDEAAHHIIVDHCSIHSGVDGNADLTNGAHHVTFQYCILGGPVGSKNQLIGGGPGDFISNISIHHNLYAKSDSRNPQVQGRTEEIDIINNLYLDWGGYAIRSQCHTEYGPSCEGLETRLNIINNYFMQASSAPDNAINFDPDDGTEIFAYTSGNRSITGIVNEDGQVATPWPSFPISQEDAGPSLVHNMTAHVGAPFRTAEEAGWVNDCIARLDDVPPVDTTPPTATGTPGQHGSVTANTIRWGWGRPTDNFTADVDHWYKFYWSTSPDVATADSTYWRIQDNYDLNGVTPETTVYAWVRARDLQGNWGPLSAMGEGATGPGDGGDTGGDTSGDTGGDDPPADTAPVLAPASVDTKFETTGIRVSWDPSPSPNVAGYRVYREEEQEATIGRVPVSGLITETEYFDLTISADVAYFYEVTTVDADGNESGMSERSWVRAAPTPPAALLIDKVYPHPVQGEATFQFRIPEVGPGHPDGVRVTIDLYDTAGRRVSRVVDGMYGPGVREVRWNPSSSSVRMTPGLYMSVIRAADQSAKSQIAIRR